MPRWPGGCIAGSFQTSRPDAPSSVERSENVWPPSALSKRPTVSAPTSSRPCLCASPETLFTFRSLPSGYAMPSLDYSHVSPRSVLERQTPAPCHSEAAVA